MPPTKLPKKFPPTRFSEPVVAEMARHFNTLACPVRIQILTTLATQPRRTVELVRITGRKVSCLSSHIALLKISGAIEPEQDAKIIHYRLSDLGRSLVKTIEDLVRQREEETAVNGELEE